MHLCERGLRSTLWRRPDGRTVRQYHDTGEWSDPSAATEERVYQAVPTRTPPAHLQRAVRHLSRAPPTIERFANRCGVEVSTAWCYATRAVEFWPLAYESALRLVHPPLLDVLYREEDHTGPLRDLMARVEDSLRGDHEWRSLRDRYAHLRLARVCLQARTLVEMAGRK